MTLDYWKDCIAEAASQCGLTLTEEQLICLAGSAESSHEYYGQAFYQPPASDRIYDIENEWKKKLKDQEVEAQRTLDGVRQAAEERAWEHESTVYRLCTRIKELEEQ